MFYYVPILGLVSVPFTWCVFPFFPNVSYQILVLIEDLEQTYFDLQKLPKILKGFNKYISVCSLSKV